MIKKLPLHDLHAENGAVFDTQNKWSLPQNYGNVSNEIHFALSTAALIDRTYLGKVGISGTDAGDLINRISTNDMSGLLSGSVCDTIFSTPKGEIVDYCRVLHIDGHYLIISNYMDSAHLMDWINRFITMEDVDLYDAGTSYLWFTLIGPEVCPMIQKSCPAPVSPGDETVWLEHDGVLIPAFLNENYTVDAYDICLAQDHKTEMAEWLIEMVEEQGGGLVGDEAFQVIRIQSGMPSLDREVQGQHNPYEARLLNAVSFTKGTYTGQEALSLLDNYDQVQRYLMIVEMDARPRKKPPLKVMFNNDPIGNLTSFTYDPLNKKHIGLAYIDRSYTVKGLDLSIEVDQGSSRIPGGLRHPLRRQ